MPASLSGRVAAIAHRATCCQTHVADHNPMLGPVPHTDDSRTGRTDHRLGTPGAYTPSTWPTALAETHKPNARSSVEWGHSDASRTSDADDPAGHSIAARRHNGYQKQSTVGRTVGLADEDHLSMACHSRPSDDRALDDQRAADDGDDDPATYRSEGQADEALDRGQPAPDADPRRLRIPVPGQKDDHVLAANASPPSVTDAPGHGPD